MNKKEEVWKEDELKKLKSCIKEKDRRIKKIEDSFKYYKNIILSIPVSLLCLSPYVFMFIYLRPLPEGQEYPLSLMVFGVIGVAGFVVGTICPWVWLMGKIWEDR